MANLDLSFRAQSLDNQFPDPAEVNDRPSHERRCE